jgi:uncharacterized membrane protein
MSQVTLTTPEVRPETQLDSMTSKLVWLGRRAAWVIIATLILLVTLFSIGPNYALSVERARASMDVIQPIFGTPEIYATYLIVVGLIGLIAFVSMAVLIYWQHGTEIIGYVVSLMLLVLGADLTNFIDALVAQYPIMAIPGDMIRALALLLPIVVLFSFPTGKSVPGWGRIPVFILAIWSLSRPFLYYTSFHPRFWPSSLTLVWFIGFLGSGLAAAGYRYLKISSPEERQQTRWIILTGGAAIGIYLIQLAVQFVVLGYDQPNTGAEVSTFPLIHTTYILGLLPVPFGLAVSIIRYRLWDLDLFINRSITYIILITLLAALGGGVLMVSLIGLEKLTGQDQFLVAAGIAAALGGLAIRPGYSFLKHFVDQHLYDIRLEYDRKLETPAALEVFGKELSSIGEYRHLQFVAYGTLANVYTAWHPTISRPLVVKILQPSLAQSEDFQERFEASARQMINLRHANIISLFDYGKIGATYYMVLEYISGPSMAEFLAKHAPVPADQIIYYVNEIADALEYAHAQGVLHHDLKPSNVMLQPVSTSALRRPILMDFGITRLIGEKKRITGKNATSTYAYLAPEQIRLRPEADQRADIYALGMIAYQLSTGSIPFSSQSPAALLLAHLRQKPVNPCAINSKLPESMGQAILKALEKNPADRYDSAGAFARALSE